jgi:hypothetical protein
MGGASRGRAGSQGSPARGARSAGRRPDLDGPSARATIPTGRGRRASFGRMSPNFSRRVSGSHRAFRASPCSPPRRTHAVSSERFWVQGFRTSAEKMSEVVRGRLARCPEMRLTCPGWWRMVLAMTQTGRRSRMCGARWRRRGFSRDAGLTAGRGGRVAATRRAPTELLIPTSPVGRAVADAQDCDGLRMAAPPRSRPHGEPLTPDRPDNLPHLETSALSAWSVCLDLGAAAVGNGGVGC